MPVPVAPQGRFEEEGSDEVDNTGDGEAAKESPEGPDAWFRVTKTEGGLKPVKVGDQAGEADGKGTPAVESKSGSGSGTGVQVDRESLEAWPGHWKASQSHSKLKCSLW